MVRPSRLHRVRRYRTDLQIPAGSVRPVTDSSYCGLFIYIVDADKSVRWSES